jgi:hypothetical protein
MTLARQKWLTLAAVLGFAYWFVWMLLALNRYSGLTAAYRRAGIFALLVTAVNAIRMALVAVTAYHLFGAFRVLDRR